MTSDFRWLVRRSGLLFLLGIAAVTTALAGAVLVQFDHFRQVQVRQRQSERVQKELELVRTQLDIELFGPLHLARFVAAEIMAHGDINSEGFSRIARILIRDNANVVDIAVSRGTRIAMVYPIEGNSTVLGHDYRKTAEQWVHLEEAIRARKSVVNGPVKLFQGGSGIIIREPVFVPGPNGQPDRFFGFVSIVLSIPKTFQLAGFDRTDLPVRLAVYQPGAQERSEKTIYGEQAILQQNPVEMDVSLPYANWHLAGMPKDGWEVEPLFSGPRIFSGLLFFLVGFTTFGTALFIFQREQARWALSTSQKEAAREAERFQALLEQASDGIHILNADGRVIEASKSFCQMLGYSREELLGKTPSLWDPAKIDACAFLAAFKEARTNGCLETRHRRKDGSTFDVEIMSRRLETGGELIFLNSTRDISERKAAEREINRLAFYDQLTGLPNRTLFTDRLQTATASGQRSGSYSALLFIDLDNFKTLNDTLGHSMGDMLLRNVAERLLHCVRGEDTVARLGGDEFLVMAPQIAETPSAAAIEAEMLAERIRLELETPYDMETTSYRCTPSIGVTFFRGREVSLTDLLRQADLAMYRAKAAGRNAICFFDRGMEEAVRDRAALEADLRQAIQEEQFELYYQAQVDETGKPIGAECLIRWHHPKRGMICPGDFIPLAEETTLILPLGQWVLRTACRQLARWTKQPGMEEFTLAVNVSIQQFRRSTFVDEVLNTLDETGASPHRLKLELTESQLLENVEEAIEKMTVLKNVGISFSLDDFGTGYSSLSYLKRLPLDQLKIDKSFVHEALINANDAVLARTVVALGQSLGLSVIAEGVETMDQRDYLLLSGCNLFQGYLFSRPLPLAVFEEYYRWRCIGDEGRTTVWTWLRTMVIPIGLNSN